MIIDTENEEDLKYATIEQIKNINWGLPHKPGLYIWQFTKKTYPSFDLLCIPGRIKQSPYELDLAETAIKI